MLETLGIKEELTFEPLSEEEKTRRGILGRLFGPVASFKAPTRNGRKYTDELWDKVFENPIVKELFDRGGLPGELDHPDREETCSEKIAIMMPERPKKDKNGHLVGYFDILDTPCGKIAAALAKYGFKFGISSRGSGDTYTDYDGEETVDPESYTLNAFDLVLIPACETAVLNLAESLQPKKSLTVKDIKLKKALNEAFTNTTSEQRKIMTEALGGMSIDYSPEKGSNIEEDSTETVAAEDNGADVYKELQESIRVQKELEDKIKSLQEKLSVCYTKETRYAEKLSQTTTELNRVKSENKELSAKVETLTESLNSKQSSLQRSTDKVASLRESMKSTREQVGSLNESLKAKDGEISQLRESMTSMRKKYEERCTQLKASNAQLTESLQEMEKDSKIVRGQMTAKVSKAQQLVEKYKSIAQTAVDKYISSQATRFGISTTDIKSRLNENYSFNDIDKVCESLKRVKLNINSLPFNVDPRNSMRMSIKESKETIQPVSNDNMVDDDVDETLSKFI